MIIQIILFFPIKLRKLKFFLIFSCKLLFKIKIYFFEFDNSDKSIILIFLIKKS